MIAPIGSPEEAIFSRLQLNLITGKDVAPLIGPRDLPDSNKGNFGHVLVIGGSVGKAGCGGHGGHGCAAYGGGAVDGGNAEIGVADRRGISS